MNASQFVRQHNERLAAANRRFRQELDAQQRVYLEQINACREEVRKLKVELRQERDRSRQLRALHRGERP
ncbi:MAG: hypothetical protein QF921_14485 [Pseudomonadales bacterium]|nr:hypothetical protein [Pseudomonadales bacterium]MDP6472669.1 hypothetical protein [Pseudomonadales bacterium]MDP6827881.1 hypothetical protein [Pseudomonadales bacterium]MDP6972689.1 hypothetical protein [Pseudomonadales bacterium]|tara:strand:- start:1330 stop:1539 length:210 start_codon:yes stop_codon:yes gene_type:complete